ncbi:hypothetical protein NXW48_04755 [Phocaeicola vulgatus]|nr:hypothetical protein [Phocaeicola vulgatus]
MTSPRNVSACIFRMPGGKRTSSVPCCMRVWHITDSESLQVTSIWMLFSDDIFNGCGEKVRDEILRMAAADKTDIRVATEEYRPGWPRPVRTNPYGTGLSPPSGISSESWASAWKSAQGN